METPLHVATTYGLPHPEDPMQEIFDLLPVAGKSNHGDVVGLTATLTRAGDSINVTGPGVLLRTVRDPMIEPATFKELVTDTPEKLTGDILLAMASLATDGLSGRLESMLTTALDGWLSSHSDTGFDMLSLHILCAGLLVVDDVHPQDVDAIEDIEDTLRTRNHVLVNTPASSHARMRVVSDLPLMARIVDMACIPPAFADDYRVMLDPDPTQGKA